MKAVFIDYMGTIVSEESSYVNEVIYRCHKQAHTKSPSEIASAWFQLHDRLLEKYCGADYKLEHDIAVETFEKIMGEYGFTDSAEELCHGLEMHWMYSPVFDDTKEFFDNCPLPVYLVSNNDDKYLWEAVKRLDIHPAGIITSEKARYYKPDRRIFQEALKASGCTPGEVVHIGDSPDSDVKGAAAAGITPWLLNREGKKEIEGVRRFGSLRDVIREIKRYTPPCIP